MLEFYLMKPCSLAYKTRGKPGKEDKYGKKGSTQTVYATENDNLEVQSGGI